MFLEEQFDQNFANPKWSSHSIAQNTHSNTVQN